MKGQKRTARWAGVLFLLMVLFGLWAELFFRQKVFVPGEGALTAANILANEWLYRAGIVSDLLMALFYLLTALALYKLLAAVQREAAAVMVIFAAAGSLILMINAQTELLPLLVLSGSSMASFDAKQLEALTLLYFTSYEHGYMIGQIFFALWVLPLGVLIYRAPFIPSVFGILFFIEAVFGTLGVLVHFLIPGVPSESLLMLPGVIAEFSFMFWLLIAGVKEPKNKPL